MMWKSLSPMCVCVCFSDWYKMVRQKSNHNLTIFSHNLRVHMVSNLQHTQVMTIPLEKIQEN